MNPRISAWLVIACTSAVAATMPTSRGDDTAPQPLVLVVMDPLAARLSCPCVAGYAQRDYEALAAHLQKSLGRPVRLGFGESLAGGLAAAKADRADVVIGKASVVRADAEASGVALAAEWSLTGADGGTDTRGLFVVPADDVAESLDEALDYVVHLGRPEHDEKYARPLDALRAAGLPEPFTTREFGSCSDAAAEMLEAKQPAEIIAVVSDYAKPLLEGCGAVPRDSLRVIGETEPVRFITAFIDESLDLITRDALRTAFRSVATDAGLLKKLESSRGFVAFVDEGWTGWRGPSRSGRVAWLPERLPERPNVVWSRPLSRSGLGGVAATRTHVIIGDRDDSDQRDVFRCFAADSDDLLWEVAYDAPGSLDYGNSPRATPLIDHGRVILLGAMGHLCCVSLTTGEVLWKRHLVHDFSVPKAALSAWGYCFSPLVADDRLIVCPGASDAAIVALDPKTGKELWRTPGRPAGYGSLIVVEAGGRRQVMGFDADSLGGWEIATGRRLWEWRPPVGGGFNVPTPVLVPGPSARVLVSNETDGTLLFEFGEDGIPVNSPRATSPDLMAEMATPVFVGDVQAGKHVVGTQDGLVVLDASRRLETLATADDAACATYAAIVGGPNGALVIGNGGRLLLYDVDADGCMLNSTTNVLPAKEGDEANAPLYSHPAIVGTRLYLRGPHDLVCVDLAASGD